MKTPITYYGGKLSLLPKILPLIPKHDLYCEPFIGGAAVFFAKQKAKVEVINDINGEIVNFYKVLQNDFNALQKEIKTTLHSRDLHRRAQVIYSNPDMFDNIKRAWAVWVLANMSFNNALDTSFTRSTDGKFSRKVASNRERFSDELTERISGVQIECRDALKVIEMNDTPESFFYVDPPYVGACQGHYDGYSQDDFNALISLLSKIKGKFLLSSYRNEALTQAGSLNNWDQIELKINTNPTGSNKSRTKIEVLTANYPINFENVENVTTK